MEVELSKGSVKRLTEGETVEAAVLQVIGIKKIEGCGGGSQYRLHLSDGSYSTRHATIPSKLNMLVDNGHLNVYSIIRANQLVVNKTEIGWISIILELDVITNGTQVGGKIGNPIELTKEQKDESNQLTSKVADPPETSLGPAPCISKPSSEPITTIYGNIKQPNSSLDLLGGAAQNENPLTAPANLGNVNLANIPTISIAEINSYSGHCAIKGKVLNKSPIRTWSKAISDGKVFSFELHDQSGAIKMNLFNEGVDNFHGIIRDGEQYVISKFTVKPANKTFTVLPHPFELVANRGTQVMPCFIPGRTSSGPPLKNEFTVISQIQSVEDDKIIDVIGVCVKKSSLEDKHTRLGARTVKKLDVFLADASNAEVKVTLWAQRAENFTGKIGDVLLVKRAKVATFNEKFLKMAPDSSLELGPNLPETHDLVAWFENRSKKVNSTTAQQDWKTVREAHLLPPNTTIKTKITVMSIKREGSVYRSCTNGSCFKKVNKSEDGNYTCEKCGFVAKTFRWRLSLSVNLADFSGGLWATCFGEHGEQLISATASQVGQLSEQEDYEEMDKIFKTPVFRNYLCTLRVKTDSFNKNGKSFTVVSLEPICAREYANKMLNDFAVTTK